MPKKARRAATRSALLAKAKDGQLHVVQSLAFEKPSTKAMLELLKGQNIPAGKFDRERTLVATNGLQRNIYLSGRNLPRLSVMPGLEINARDILLHKHLVIDAAVFEQITSKPRYEKPSRKPKGTRKAAGEETQS